MTFFINITIESLQSLILSNELKIDKARILICINNIMKQENEIRAVGSKFKAFTKSLYVIFYPNELPCSLLF
jgi:hypothetical protein